MAGLDDDHEMLARGKAAFFNQQKSKTLNTQQNQDDPE